MQMINYDKSVCMFNKNLEANQGEDIIAYLGVKHSSSLGHYLSLPMQNGKNIQVLFKRLQERVWKALQGWKGKMFSMGGKELGLQ